MMMITIPAAIDSSADQVRIRPPTKLALAPSATNTVEKPSTNVSAEISTARRDADGVSPVATCSMVAPVR